METNNVLCSTLGLIVASDEREEGWRVETEAESEC